MQNYEGEFHFFSGRININWRGGAEYHQKYDPLEEKVFRLSLTVSFMFGFLKKRGPNMYLGVSLSFYVIQIL